MPLPGMLYVGDKKGGLRMYYAHIRDDGAVQTVMEHLIGTAERCAAFASAFQEEKRGELLGYAHDIGKCSEVSAASFGWSQG